MELYSVYSRERHPAIHLLFLGLLAIFGLLIFAIIGIAMVYALYGQQGFSAILGQDLSNQNHIAAFRILLTAQQLGLFATPAILLAITEQIRPSQFYPSARPKASLLFVVFWLLLFSLPFVGYVNALNQQMHLPLAWKAVEEWMRNMENQNMVATNALLSTVSWKGLLANLLTIAIIPAICEELLFRGAIQRCLARWFKNPHVAIWATAIIFSAIHLQFYGFFTRMLLGAGLSYIYYFTGSIWYNVFAHFLNNGYAVIVAFYYQKKHLPLAEADMPSVGWMGTLTSAILTLVLFRVLSRMAKDPRPRH